MIKTFKRKLGKGVNNNTWEAIKPWCYVAFFIALFMLLPFWYALLALFVFYMILSMWELWNNPYIFALMNTYIDKWELKKNDKWYAKTIRYISRPVYWFVDKALERWEKEDDEEQTTTKTNNK